MTLGTGKYKGTQVFKMLPIPTVITCGKDNNENEGFPQPLNELSERELRVIANKWAREFLKRNKRPK
jgi:hypothetical protein